MALVCDRAGSFSTKNFLNYIHVTILPESLGGKGVQKLPFQMFILTTLSISISGGGGGKLTGIRGEASPLGLGVAQQSAVVLVEILHIPFQVIPRRFMFLWFA